MLLVWKYISYFVLQPWTEQRIRFSPSVKLIKDLDSGMSYVS